MTSCLFAVSVTVVVLISKVKSFCSPLTGVLIVITLLSNYIKLTRTLKVERKTLLKLKKKNVFVQVVVVFLIQIRHLIPRSKL